MMQNKNFVWIFFVLAIMIGGVLYMMYPTPDKYSSEDVACTMEAKQCPDGSYVGRQGPKCEFAPCPVKTMPEGAFMEDGTIDGSLEASTTINLR